MADPTSATVAQLQSALRQKSVEVRRDGLRIAAQQEAEADQPSSDATFANVKTFCTIAPVRMPRVLTMVSSTITAMASSCWVVSPSFPDPSR